MTLTVARYRAARGQNVFRYLTILTTGTSHGRQRISDDMQVHMNGPPGRIEEVMKEQP